MVYAHGSLQHYETPFSTVYDSLSYRRFDNSLPPSGLLVHENWRIYDRDTFHGENIDQDPRGWRLPLRAPTDGLEFLMPSLLEIIQWASQPSIQQPNTTMSSGWDARCKTCRVCRVIFRSILEEGVVVLIPSTRDEQFDST